MTLDAIQLDFARAFIKAISAQSVEDCADLVLTYEDCATLGVDYEMSETAYRERLIEQSKNFLKEKGKFIDSKNAQADSAINLENFEGIDTYEFKLEEGYEAGFIRTISISMRTRVVDEVCYRVGFQLNDAILVNGKIRINNLHSVKMSESYWDHVTKENTPYALIQDKEVLRALVKKHAPDHADKSYMDALRHLRDWYVHEGDLELETYASVKVGLIVTGNLTIKEPIADVSNELVVLGKTSLNTLFIDDTNNVLLLGGINFETAIFVTYSAAYLIFNQPQGPLFHAHNETCEIDDRQGIKHFWAPNLDRTDDIPSFLKSGFYAEEELDDDEPDQPAFYHLDYDAIFSALRAGKPIFKT